MRGARSAPLAAGLGAAVLTLSSCAVAGGGSVTSGGDPTDPVPFRWSLTAGVLRLQGGTLHAIPSEVRLLDEAGGTAVSAAATPLGTDERGLCGEADPTGTVSVRVRVPDPGDWPGSYRLEALVGDRWRAAALTKAC